MSLLTLRQAIVDDLTANLPALKTCEGHGGRFDANEVKRVAAKAPALFVACLGVSDTDEAPDGIAGTVQWGAFVVARDTGASGRDEGGLAILQALLLHLPGNRWGLDQAEGRPQAIRAQNLYSATVDKMGVAMWAVSWRQRMVIGAELDPATLDVFATFDAVYDLDQPTGSGEPEANDHLTGLDQA